MFSTLCIAYTLFVAAFFANARVVPRTCAPTTYDGALLEPYPTYHKRYVALGCENKHGQAFFNTCCHPLLANEQLSSRPAECNPSSDKSTPPPAPKTTTTKAAAPKNTPPPPPPPAAKPKQPASSSSDGAPNTGGVATFFFQNGVAGACGQIHQDTDLICAMDSARYGNAGNESPLCGRQVQITNTLNQKKVIVHVADDCPTCDNANSIDLSQTAFEHIATLDQGEVPIEWVFL
jgi:hypothetical protein